MLVRRIGSGDDAPTFAAKYFKVGKSSGAVGKEAKWQALAAEAGAAPRVLGHFVGSGRRPCIVMERMDETIVDVCKAQGGRLSAAQQRAILRVYERLDGAGVLHNDSNPLNLMMRRGGGEGAEEWMMVDFGFSKKVDKKKHGANPNLRMSLHTLLNSGTRGLLPTRRITEPPALLLAALEQNVHRPVMPDGKEAGAGARAALSPLTNHE